MNFKVVFFTITLFLASFYNGIVNAAALAQYVGGGGQIRANIGASSGFRGAVYPSQHRMVLVPVRQGTYLMCILVYIIQPA